MRHGRKTGRRGAPGQPTTVATRDCKGGPVQLPARGTLGGVVVGWCGRVEVHRGNRIAGLDGIGVGPATKAAPVADEELYRWLCMSLVRVQLLPSAENVQLSHESPRNCCLLQRPHGLRIAILMTSHTHTCTHTHTHTCSPCSPFTHLEWCRQHL